jgi:hypothetical protein
VAVFLVRPNFFFTLLGDGDVDDSTTDSAG